MNRTYFFLSLIMGYQALLLALVAAVGDKTVKIDVAEIATGRIEQRVGRAGVAVADHQPVDRRGVGEARP